MKAERHNGYPIKYYFVRFFLAAVRAQLGPDLS